MMQGRIEVKGLHALPGWGGTCPLCPTSSYAYNMRTFTTQHSNMQAQVRAYSALVRPHMNIRSQFCQHISRLTKPSLSMTYCAETPLDGSKQDGVKLR